MPRPVLIVAATAATVAAIVVQAWRSLDRASYPH